MKPTACPEAHDLAALLENDAAGEAPECAAHLETCPRCRQTLTDLAADHSTWTEMARRLPQLVDTSPGSGRLPTCEQALERVMVQLKDVPPLPTETAPVDLEEESLSFLRASDRPGLLGYLGDYEIHEVIGRGGMGVVFKAFDPALGRLVAIKVLAPHWGGSSTARKRFLREGRAAATIAHDHVVSIYEVDATASSPYLVMQYVAGPSLQNKLDRTGPLPVPEIVRIGMQIAEGLAAAHKEGLIHRDVKPSNILLENDEQVKITDFGLARAVDDDRLTQSGVVSCTPAYTAPEQARAEPLDARADLFSLGSVLYALCTGHPPFRAGSALAMLRRVSDERPPPLRSVKPDVPDWLEEIVTKLHARNPGDRFGSAAEVATLLRQHLAHLRQPSTVPQPPRLANTSSLTPVRRRPRRRLWIAAALLGAVALGAAVLVLRDDPPLAIWHSSPQDIACGAIAPDGKTLVSGSWDGSISLWDVGTGTVRKKVPGFSKGLQAVAISPNSEKFATAADDRVVRIWETATGEPRAALHGHAGPITGLAFSPDGMTLASVGGNRFMAGELKLWDVAAGKERLLVAPITKRVWGVAYAPDGKSVAVACGDGTAQIVDTNRGKVLASFDNDNRSYVRRVAFSPDGKHLALTYDDEGYVRIYEVKSRKLRSGFQAPGKLVSGLQFSADGKRLLTPCGDGSAVLWDVSQPQVRAARTLKGHKGPLRFAVFFPDSQTIATGGDDRRICLWSVGKQE